MVRLFNLILAGVSGVAVTRPGDAVTARPGGVLGGAGHSKATFSIFFWLQVANFDVFLFLVLHVCYLSFAGLFYCLCCVNGTEQQLIPARNVLFWNQVFQTNQFIFPALGPLISRLSGGRVQN
jgi:hypothetical protein